jgi:acylphosphatase
MKQSNVAEIVRAHVIVSGRVQGVNFRASARDQARKAQIAGWVRNLADGSVEALFEGPRADVQRLVSWCYSGPVPARVASVTVNWEPPTGQEKEFQILW